ncbi:hypothetical protein SESBI_40442 [Sesbania bispinosa]|nr:hypothetical protein SESBI_40442 [Sesbania bispinosa]
MATHKSTISSSQLLPLVNFDIQTQKVRSVLPFFGFINMTFSCGITIYRAYNHNDTPMIVFITFVYFGSFLLDYWSRLYHKLPPSQLSSKRRNLKIGMWVLLSTIMLGFACEFSTFLRLTQSICFFGVVIAGNAFLFYVYFIWDGNKSSSACSTHVSRYNDGNAEHKEYKLITEDKGVDNV